MLDDVWSDKYLNRVTTVEERRVAKRAVEKNWGKDIKEGEEMMEMILNIQARFWPEVESRI